MKQLRFDLCIEDIVWIWVIVDAEEYAIPGSFPELRRQMNQLAHHDVPPYLPEDFGEWDDDDFGFEWLDEDFDEDWMEQTFRHKIFVKPCLIFKMLL